MRRPASSDSPDARPRPRRTDRSVCGGGENSGADPSAQVIGWTGSFGSFGSRGSRGSFGSFGSSVESQSLAWMSTGRTVTPCTRASRTSCAGA